MGVYRMESKIPLPTDNIYKFYALFGLMLLITVPLFINWISNITKENLYRLVKEYRTTSMSKEKTL